MRRRARARRLPRSAAMSLPTWRLLQKRRSSTLTLALKSINFNAKVATVGGPDSEVVRQAELEFAWIFRARDGRERALIDARVRRVQVHVVERVERVSPELQPCLAVEARQAEPEVLPHAQVPSVEGGALDLADGRVAAPRVGRPGGGSRVEPRGGGRIVEADVAANVIRAAHARRRIAGDGQVRAGLVTDLAGQLPAAERLAHDVVPSQEVRRRVGERVDHRMASIE